MSLTLSARHIVRRFGEISTVCGRELQPPHGLFDQIPGQNELLQQPVRVVVLLHVDPFLVPRLDLVPVLLARSGDVVRARPAASPVSPVPEPHAASVTFLQRRRCPGAAAAAAAEDRCRFEPPGAAAGEPVQTGHGHGHRLLVPAAIVVELQRLADSGDQRVHLFGVHGDGLLQKDVVLLPAGHRGAGSSRFCPFYGVCLCMNTRRSSPHAAPTERQARRICKQWVTCSGLYQVLCGGRGLNNNKLYG